MRIVVTGGAGFIGAHLVRALAGHDILIVDDLSTGTRPPHDTPFLELDVRSPNAAGLIASFEPHQIYHLACPASPPAYQRDPVRTLETCHLGTSAVLRAAEKCGSRVLLASTSEVYGDPPATEHPQRESYRGNVNSWGARACYDEGKRAAESLAWCYQQRGVEVRVARIFNTYGPGMAVDDGRIVSNFVAQALRGETMTVYGDGSQTRSLCYVSDTVRGLLALMDSLVEGPVNIGNPEEVSVLDLAARVRLLVGSTSPIESFPLPPDDPRQRRPDIGRAGRLLGWRPEVSIDEGLRLTIDDFRARIG